MKKYIGITVLCVVLSYNLIGCKKVNTTVLEEKELPITVDTDVRATSGEKISEKTAESKTYYLETDNTSSAMLPSLTLFDDGTFHFSYDILSSYLSYGTCEIKENQLIATTNDNLYHYVFQIENDQYIFVQEESSDVPLVNSDSGIPVTDGCVFVPKESLEKNQVKMTAVVKEIEEDCLLVSSRTDEIPGVYYVYFGDIDISKIKGGDEITIFWDGAVLESDPAQIYIDSLEKAE